MDRIVMENRSFVIIFESMDCNSNLKLRSFSILESSVVNLFRMDGFYFMVVIDFIGRSFVFRFEKGLKVGNILIVLEDFRIKIRFYFLLVVEM